MADTPLGKMIIEMGLDDANFSKGITGVNKQLTALKNDLKTSQTSFSTFGKGIDGVKSPMEVLTKSIEKQKEQLALLKKSYSGSLVDGKATSSTQNYATQISRANAQLVQYQAQLKAAAVEQYKQTSYLPQLSSGFSKLSSGLDSVAAKTAPASLAVTAVFAKGIQAATNFNGKMTEIQALLSDGTPAGVLSKQMDTLSSKSKGWAQQYGIDTSSINEGMEEMIKRGYNFNQTVGAMPSVLDAARASGDDFGTVMSSSTAILEQFGLKTNDTASMMKNTQRVTDSLTFVANKTSAGFSDMGTAMEYVGPVANSLGMSLEETSSAIGLLSNNGIEGDKAGTALRGALSRLLKPTKQSSVAFQELGVNLEEWKKGNIGLPDMLDTIKKSTEGMTDAEKSSLIAKAFGTEAQTGMNILIHQGGDALRDLTKETQNATGYTKKLADQMNDSDKNAFNKAKASLEVLSINLGQKLLPSIVPIVKEIDNLAGSFEKLSPETQQFIIKMAIATAAIAPTAKALSGLTSIVSGVTGGLAKLGAKGAGKLALKGIATEAAGATTAIGGAGGLTSSLGGLSPILAGLGPVAIGALGVAGLTGVILAVQKVTEKARGELQQTSDWGTVVGSSANQQLTTFQGKLENFNSAFSTFESSGVNAAQNVTKAFKDLASTTTGDIDKATESLSKKAKDLGISDKEINDWKSKMDLQKSNVQTMSDQVIAIYEQQAKKHEDLTTEQLNIVKNNESQIMEAEVNSLQISGDKKAAVQAAIYGKINDKSEEQLKKYKSAIEKAVEAENKGYESNMTSLKQTLDQGLIGQEEYKTRTEALSKQHSSIMERYGTSLARVMQESIKTYQTSGAAAEAWQEKTKKQFEDLGLSYDQITSKMGKPAYAAKDSSGLVAQYTSNMTSDGKKAADAWNAMVYDKKTGTVTSNAVETVSKAINAEGGWQKIEFITKNAKLDTNALITVAQAAQANGIWNSLTPAQKNLTVNNKEGLEAIVNSKNNLQIWNSLPVNVKNMLGNNSDFINKKGAATSILEAWNALPTKEKELKAVNLTVQPKEEAQRVIDSLRDKRVTLGALNGTIVPTFQAQQTIDSLHDKKADLSAVDNTGFGVSQAAKTIASLQPKPVGIDADPSQANWKVQNLLSSIPTSRTIDLIVNKTNNAQGTPYHPGGLATVNDQKGSTYRELISLPNGVSFIPQARDVTMPLPRGTKILKASKTAKLIPKYANGTGGIPADAKIFRDMKTVQQQLIVNAPDIGSNARLDAILKALEGLKLVADNNDVITAVNRLAKRPAVSVFDSDRAAATLTNKITSQQNKKNLIESMLGGERP